MYYTHCVLTYKLLQNLEDWTNPDCSTEIVQGYFKDQRAAQSIYGQAVKVNEQLEQKSYFSVKENEVKQSINAIYLAVLKALYWITIEEIANLKSIQFAKFIGGAKSKKYIFILQLL